MPSAGPQVVYAKEPLFRYITQFYTDTDLTLPWQPGNSGTINVRTVQSGGTNYEEAGNYTSNSPNNYPFEFAGAKGLTNGPGSTNTQNQELRAWRMEVSANGAVTAGTQQPLTAIN